MFFADLGFVQGEAAVVGMCQAQKAERLGFGRSRVKSGVSSAIMGAHNRE